MNAPAQEISVPSKIILFGEHAVVYGTTGVVCAVDLYSKVSITQGTDRTIQISLNAHGYSMPVEQFNQFSENVSEYGVEYARKQVPQDIHDAIGLMYILHIGAKTIQPKIRIDALDISITSMVEPGSGLGYSASFSAGIAMALAALSNATLSNDEISNIVSVTEKFFHGNPSGIDQSAILEGGFLEFSKDLGVIRTYSSIPDVFKKCILIFTGKPDGTTKQAIEKAKGYFDTFGTVAFDELFIDLNRAFTSNDFVLFLDVVRKNQALLVEIGVSSSYADSLISDIEEIGGAAKITGAGTSKGDSVGMMIAFHDDISILEKYLKKKNLIHFSANIGTPGLLGMNSSS